MNLQSMRQSIRQRFGFQVQDETAQRRSRPRRARHVSLIEGLEDRQLLTAFINVDGSNALTYLGSALNDNVTISNSGTTYTFHDPGQNIIFLTTNGLPTTGNNSPTVTITGISAISLFADGGSNTVNVQSTAVPTAVNTGGINDSVNVGSLAPSTGGTLAGILAPLTFAAPIAGSHTITIDDSGNAVGQTATLSGNSSSSVLSGLAPQSITFNPQDARSLHIFTGTGADVLTVDFTSGNPLPDDGPTSTHLSFDGGVLGAGDKLVLLGDPTAGNNFSFDTEVYNATGSGQGDIVLTQGLNSQTIGFVNLTPVEDSAVATDYILNLNSASHEFGLTDTTIGPGATPAVLIADNSGAIPPTFESAAVANKTNITINTTETNATEQPAENDVTINNPTQPAGLSTLTINGGSIDDIFKVIATTPNVLTTLNAGDGDDLFYVDGAGLSAGSTLVANGGPSYDTINVTATTTNPTVTASSLSNLGGPGAFNYTSIEEINLVKLASPPVATPTTINAIEAKTFTDRVVANFTVSTNDLGAGASDFIANINWGDGSNSGGWIVPDGLGGYQVLGSHTYKAAASYPVTVTITATGSSAWTVIPGTNTALYVTSAANPAAVATANSTANVAAAPLYPHAVQISGFEGIALSPLATGVVVATFADSGTVLDPSLIPPPYTASIDWGDGTVTSSTQILWTGTPNGTTYSVYGNHTYAQAGVYPVTVTITKTPNATEPLPGAQTIAISTATIADAPLLAVSPQPTVNATAGAYFSGAVGAFIDTNLLSSAATDFRLTIDWGDGTPWSVGYISGIAQVPGGIQYTISGQHTYASSLFTGSPGPGVPGPVNSTFPLTIYVEDIDGAAVNLSNTANVAGLPVIITAHLDPASDSGASNSDGITNVVQPTIRGTANQPYVRVLVYASPTTGGATIPLGTATTDSTGAWSLTSNVALLDGSYSITAIGIDSANQIISQSATSIPNPVVIDTVGPKVTYLFFDRGNGQIDVNYEDRGGIANSGVGMNQSTIIDANNYKLTKAHQKRGYLVDVVSVTPGTLTGPQSATLYINGGQYLRGGRYVFSIFAADVNNRSGVQDIAGNAFDGEYYGYVPTGNNVRGGNLIARLNAIHNTIYAPGSVIGAATPVQPPGNRLPNIIFHRYQPISMPTGKLATRLSTKMAVRNAAKTI